MIYSCTHMATVGVKGLNSQKDITTTVTFKKHLKTLLFNVAYCPTLQFHSYTVFYVAFYN